MKLTLGLGKSCSLLGCSSSRSKRSDPTQPHPHVGYLNADVEKHRGGSQSNSSSAPPPPYTTVATIIPEIHINGVPHDSDGRSSPAAGGSARGASQRTTFASSNRLRDIAYLQAPMRRESRENALDMLRAYDTVVVMDDSGSMLRDGRWEQACEALSELAQIAATYDKDGIDIHFLNHPKCGMNIKDPKSVRHLFKYVRPRGLTPIADKLDVLVGDYVEKLESAARKKRKGDSFPLKQIKPVNFIVITDGAPTDEPVDSIVSLARRLDRGHFPLSQVGIQFVQIGNDKEATEFLKQLDDDLSRTYGVRDMVDTTPFLGVDLTAEMLIKILLGGVNRRVDRRGGGAVMSV